MKPMSRKPIDFSNLWRKGSVCVDVVLSFEGPGLETDALFTWPFVVELAVAGRLPKSVAELLLSAKFSKVERKNPDGVCLRLKFMNKI